MWATRDGSQLSFQWAAGPWASYCSSASVSLPVIGKCLGGPGVYIFLKQQNAFIRKQCYL